MESWQQYHISDLISQGILLIGDGYRAKNAEFRSKGIPFARVSNIVNNGFDFANVDLFPKDDLSKVGNKISHSGDIVFTSKGTVGRFAFVKDEIRPFVYSPQLCFWRVHNTDTIDPGYLFYWMQGPEFTNQCDSVKNQTDMADYVSLKDQRSMKITLPPLPEQHTIARILSSLDDKIELNRKMNATLEAMAQALFRSWFVDFDPVRAKAEGREPAGMDEETAALFPDGFEEVDGKEVPVGWTISTVGSVIDLAYGKALKEDIRCPGNIPVYGSNGQVGWHDEYLVKGPGIIVGRKGNPGVVTWSQTDFFPIDTTFYVVPKKKSMCLSYLYYELKSQNLAFQRSDSAVPGLNRNIAYLNTTIIPSEDIIKRFDTTVRPLFELIYSNINQSRTLAALRDTLLPRLLSGEVRMPFDEKEKAVT
jgi:type I restriction enzyme S subunit